MSRPAGEARAAALLGAILTPTQRRTWAAGYLDVAGSAGGRYRLIRMPGEYTVIYGQAPGGTIFTCCARPGGWLPLADVIAAQVLHLRYDEPGFLRVANCRVSIFSLCRPRALPGPRWSATKGGR